MSKAVISRLAGSSARDAMSAAADAAIRNQLARLVRMLDARQLDDLGSVFVENVLFDYGDGAGERSGLATMTELFATHLGRCGHTQHMLGSISITIDGDRATSAAYVQARHLAIGPPAVPWPDAFDTNGDYLDQWRLIDDRWLITRRDASWHMFVGDPAIVFGQA
jgi:hypothetical protein